MTSSPTLETYPVDRFSSIEERVRGKVSHPFYIRLIWVRRYELNLFWFLFTYGSYTSFCYVVSRPIVAIDCRVPIVVTVGFSVFKLPLTFHSLPVSARTI